MDQAAVEHQAKRLRELFRNRFSQTIAEKLVKEFDGEQPALDFLLTENEEEVARYMKESPGYLQDLRRDSSNLASILENGFESSVRMFGCGTCQKTWWRRVPFRKEVSVCRHCKVKYDPIPRDKEWGWGKFICSCGNEFTGFAKMNETTSVCYKCDESCMVDHILPPRRNNQRKSRSRNPHSCSAPNCYNCDGGYVPNVDVAGLSQGSAGFYANGYVATDGPGAYMTTGEPGAYPGPGQPSTCVHPKSQKPLRKKLHWTSEIHRSTGSTVTDVLSQYSIDTASVSESVALCSIAE